MLVWGITRSVHAAHSLSGEGAARAGNRWNSKGVRIAYTSTSPPLVVLEMLVHVTRDCIPAALLVPAVVLPAEMNLLVNPLRPEFSKVKIQAPEHHAVDHRLLR